MTTGTLQYKALEIPTSKFKKLNCALCLVNGDFIDNLSFCIECKSYYCPACLSNHLNSKQAVRSQTRPQVEQIISAGGEKSNTGPSKNGTENANSVGRNPAETDTGGTRDYNPASQTDAYKNLANVLRKKQFELLSLTTQKDAILNIMRQFRDFTEDLLQEFEASIEEKVTAEEEKTKSVIDQEIQQLETTMKDLNNNTSTEDLTKSRSNTSKVDKDNEKGRVGGKKCVSESYSNMQNILETAIEDFTYRVNKTGSYLIEESDWLFVPSDKHEIRLKEDKTGCDINDMCLLEDGSLLLCDWNNMNIKRLGTNRPNNKEGFGLNMSGTDGQGPSLRDGQGKTQTDRGITNLSQADGQGLSWRDGQGKTMTIGGITSLSQTDGHGLSWTDGQGRMDKHVPGYTWQGTEVTLRDFCPLPSVPWAICQTGQSEVAVSMILLQKIQFVRVTSTTMKPIRSFKVGEVCRGICCTDSKLIVSCGGGGIGEGPGHLRIFNKFGALLNTVHYKSPEDPIISCPFHLTVMEDVVYLTDREKGLVCLQWSGLHDLERSKLSPTIHLALAKGICEGSERELYICDFRNGKVIQLNTQTGMSRVVVEQCSPETGPQAVCYSKTRGQLVVASGNADFIHTYQLQLIQASRNTYL